MAFYIAKERNGCKWPVFFRPRQQGRVSSVGMMLFHESVLTHGVSIAAF
jgi:hypothetical protein